jgi:hypothetical protein
MLPPSMDSEGETSQGAPGAPPPERLGDRWVPPPRRRRTLSWRPADSAAYGAVIGVLWTAAVAAISFVAIQLILIDSEIQIFEHRPSNPAGPVAEAAVMLIAFEWPLVAVFVVWRFSRAMIRERRWRAAAGARAAAFAAFLVGSPCWGAPLLFGGILLIRR